jgi:hypothetical protein
MFVPEATFQFFGLIDGISIFVWLLIIVITSTNIRNKNRELAHYKYYLPGLFIKLGSAIAFSILYIIKYEGGDTVAYWDCAQKLNNLLFHNFQWFLQEFFTTLPNRERFLHFDFQNTGMPPNWIYNENEGWFASKVMFLLSFITFRSYFAMTLLCAFFSFKASWILYEMALKYKAGTIRNLAIATLYLPSTAFWCTGISKDMIVYTCVIYALHYMFQFYDPSIKKGVFFYFKLLILYFLLSNIRDFMLVVALFPFLFSLGMRWSNRESYSNSTKLLLKIFIVLMVLVGMLTFFSSSKAQEFSEEAQLIQTDLKNNTEYGGVRYDLGITDYSPIGMLKAMPISIYTAFFRPYIWEASSIFILISALETFLFVLLSATIPFRIGIRKFIKMVQENEFLITALVFSLILGYFAGYTSGLFGVLVRFKAPLLPFFYILLTSNLEKNINVSILK